MIYWIQLFNGFKQNQDLHWNYNKPNKQKNQQNTDTHTLHARSDGGQQGKQIAGYHSAIQKISATKMG